MQAQSGHYKMNRPKQDDIYNIDDFNTNTDILDAELKRQGTALDAHSGDRANPHGVTAEQVGAAPVDHTHDDRYYTEAEITAQLAEKADATAVETALPTKMNVNPTVIDAAIDLFVLQNGQYMYEGIVPAGMNYPPELVGQYIHAIILVCGRMINGAFGYGVITLSNAYGGDWTNVAGYYNWVGWQRIATATPPQEYDLPLAEGKVGIGYNNTYRKGQDGRVTLFAAMKRADDADLLGVEVAFILPAGYRPFRHEVRHINLTGGDGNPAGYAHLHIYTDGTAQVMGIGTGAKSAFCECGFWTA